MNISAKTAIYRKRMSSPCDWFTTFEIMPFDFYGRILDFGCGRGRDVMGLRRLGYNAEGYDPNFRPNKPRGKFDIVLMTYVVNVLEESERNAAIEAAWGYVKKHGLLVITSRTESDVNYSAQRSNWKTRGRGFITSKGTYQRGYTAKQLDRLVSRLLSNVRTIQYGPTSCGGAMVIVTKG